MGIAGASVVPPAQRCTRCRARWKQKGGLCRACCRADQVSDPVQVALEKVRRYIQRGLLQAQHLDGAQRAEAVRRTIEATDALDLIAASLRSQAR